MKDIEHCSIYHLSTFILLRFVLLKLGQFTDRFEGLELVYYTRKRWRLIRGLEVDAFLLRGLIPKLWEIFPATAQTKRV